MLIGIDPRISPDLLHTLARMGHGDELVIADANFPANSIAETCSVSKPIDMLSNTAVECIELITAIMPLDAYFDYAALRMEIDNAPTQLGDVHSQAFKILESAKPADAKLSSLERQSFYAQARSCFAVVQAKEARPFGCFILRKGVIF